MTANRALEKHEIPVDELKRGMVITAYTRFSDQYKPMTRAVCSFIKFNFKQSSAIVTRYGQRMTVPIDQIQEGDTLNRIFKFPPELIKRTVVASAKFTEELKKRGMLGFQIEKFTPITDEKAKSTTAPQEGLREMLRLVGVSAPTQKQLTVKQERKRRRSQVANALLENVQRGVSIKEKAVATIQDTMDRIRKGGINTRSLEKEVQQMLRPEIADGITTAIGLKMGDPIYYHSVDVGAVFQMTYLNILEKSSKRSSFINKENATLGAVLHDIGKSKIPKELVVTNAPYDKNSREMQIIRSHPNFGAEILLRMNVSDAMIEMARYHHVKKNTSMLSSYPQGMRYEKINFETRLLAIIDMYQAFVGKRRYKKIWSAPATMRYLDALGGLEFDERIWEWFLHEVGIYPKGSLVMLNDHSLAFVLSVPDRVHDLERPLVAVFRNGRGDTLTHHDLIDLREEKDIAIIKDLEATTVLGDRALEQFTGLSA